MKRITLILSLILSILVPIQAQDYLYMKDADPIKKSLDKLYIKEFDEKYYADFGPDPIAGVYNAYGLSQAQQVQVEWPITITRDKQSENKIWIHPVISPFGGLQAHDIQSVYAYYDAIAGTINLPMGQLLYSGSGFNIQLVYYDSTNDFILSTGAVILSVNNVDGNPVITFPDLLGAYDVNSGAWFEIISNITLDRTDATLIESLIPLTEIDSISKVAPELRWLSYEKNQYNQGIFNVLFNYNLLVPNIRPGGKEFVTQGWFNETISYKAYDSENNIVKEDYIDVFNTSRNNVEIMMVALLWDGESGGASYDIDGFLPCDTALQVAFTISPGALVWAGDSTQAFKGVESYVDEQGQGHGIVIDYYNERPRLLSTSPLSFDPTNPRVAYLRFSERMNVDYQEYTISVYRKEANSGKYSLINTTTNYWGLAFSADEIDVQVPDDIALQEGDIVAVSYDNWGVYDKNYSRATPFSMESGIDAEGNPYGMWWMVECVPYIVNQDTNAFPNQISYTFNTEIVRTDDMGEIGYSLIYYGTEFTTEKEVASGVITNVYASGNTLTLELPKIKFTDEGYYKFSVKFAQGAVTDLNGKQMQATTVLIYDGSIFGVWAPSIQTRKRLTYSRDDREIKVKFNDAIFRTDEMPPVAFEVYNENHEVYATGEFVARAEDITLYLTLPEDVVLNANEKSTIFLKFPQGAVENEYGTLMLPVDCDWDANGEPTGYYAIVDMSTDNPGTETSAFFREGTYNFNFDEDSAPVDFTFVASDVDLGTSNSATQWELSGLLSGLYGAVASENTVPAYSYLNNNGAEELYIVDYNDPNGGSIGTVDVMGNGKPKDVYMVSVVGSGPDYLGWLFTVDGNMAKPAATSLYLAYIENGGLYGLLQIDDLSITQDGVLEVAKVRKFSEPIKIDAKVAPLDLGALKLNFKQ